ncbi:FUT-1 [Mytilus edulis]|uniref:Fucosyltransferase n=1 Tax=Mytilus edulis TaxID=6550 RepID=A0A8S3S076_MYTED|nr:FUT-1 [Mytilus edulis]
MRFTNNSLLLVLGIILYTIAITLLTNVYLDNGRIITTTIAALADTKYNNDLRPSNEAKGKKTYSVENINKGNADTTINKVYSIRWNRKPFWASTDTLSYKFRNCAFRNCIICESEDGTPHGTCDAILFHHTEMDITVPNKTPGQTWVFMSYESEVHTLKHVLKNEWNNTIDWVISYRSDADISFPYGVLDRIQKQTYKNYTHIFLKKSKNVAWVASNCKSVSKRYQYIKEMMKSIDIDIYGKCGKTCSSSWNSDTCFKDLSKDYKFYLAFENSICDDYVSEKAFRLFQDGFNIIPV